MTSISSVSELDPVHIEIYFELVRDSVALLGGDPSTVDRFIAEHEKRPPEEQLLLFNREPVALAADLASDGAVAVALTEEHLKGHDLLKQKYGWGA